jgi:hypothetical protein
LLFVYAFLILLFTPFSFLFLFYPCFAQARQASQASKQASKQSPAPLFFFIQKNKGAGESKPLRSNPNFFYKKEDC